MVVLESAPDGGETQSRSRSGPGCAAVSEERGMLIPFSGALPAWCRWRPSLASLEGPEVFPHFPEVAAGSTWAAAMADTDPDPAATAAASAAVRFKSK